MKFDVVIGNPPYQKGKNSNFYVKFIQRASSLLKEGGYLSYIIPNRFVLPHHPAAKALLLDFQLLHLRVDVKDWFPSVGTSIGHVSAIKKTGGHRGEVTVELLDGAVMISPDQLSVPSRAQRKEDVETWGRIATLSSYTFSKNRPESGEFVFVRRQWRTKSSVVYLDAYVGDDPTGYTDGRYLPTDNPESVVKYLRESTMPGTLHRFFGDQMNLWPPLWDKIPTEKEWDAYLNSQTNDRLN